MKTELQSYIQNFSFPCIMAKAVATKGYLQEVELNSLTKKADINYFLKLNKLNFKDYIDTFLNHNYQCIEKEYTYDLEKSKKRLEIVEGLIKALEDIDNIIALIKSSNSSKDAVINLINKYQFTENQAQAIVNMKLGRLTHLEVIELNQEKIDLTSTIANCEDIITHLDKKKQIFTAAQCVCVLS